MNEDGKPLQQLVIPGAEHLPPEARELLYRKCVTIGFWRAVNAILPLLSEDQRKWVRLLQAGEPDVEFWYPEFLQWMFQEVPYFSEICSRAILCAAQELAQ